MKKKKVNKHPKENLIERPKLHNKPMKRYYGVDEFRCRGVGIIQDYRKATYATDRECIEAGDICASPALFER
jgi:hypothetical protein